MPPVAIAWLPVAWQDGRQPADASAAAKARLSDPSVAVQLAAASWLLSSPERSEATAVLRQLSSHERVEKELMVLVSPFLVSPMEAGQQVCLPGEEILDPNDCEFYFLNRIEGRTGRPFRSPTAWDNPLGLVQKLKLERRAICGPVGYSK